MSEGDLYTPEKCKTLFFLKAEKNGVFNCSPTHHALETFVLSIPYIFSYYHIRKSSVLQSCCISWVSFFLVTIVILYIAIKIINGDNNTSIFPLQIIQ